MGHSKSWDGVGKGHKSWDGVGWPSWVGEEYRGDPWTSVTLGFFSHSLSRRGHGL